MNTKLDRLAEKLKYPVYNYNIVDIKSIVIDGIDMRDYPDFCDAYISDACFNNGIHLNDTDLYQLNVDAEDLIYDMACDSIF